MEEREGRKIYHYLLDELLGLKSNQREKLEVRRQGVELASDHPYRQAAELLGREIREEVSHRTLHRWVQEEGRKLYREEETKRERVFEEGDTLPPGSCEEDGEEEEREIVVVEANGTMLFSQERGGIAFALCILRRPSFGSLRSLRTEGRHSKESREAGRWRRTSSSTSGRGSRRGR